MQWSLSLSRTRARIGMHHSRTHSDSLALPRRPSRLDARNAATRDRELIAPELCRYIKRSIQYVGVRYRRRELYPCESARLVSVATRQSCSRDYAAAR